MNDIVKRLRDTNRPDAMGLSYPLRLEAAAEIERLRKYEFEIQDIVERHDERINQARSDALEEAAKVADKWRGEWRGDSLARRLAAEIREMKERP